MKKNFLSLQYRNIGLSLNDIKRISNIYVSAFDIFKLRGEIDKNKMLIEKKNNELVNLDAEIIELENFSGALEIKCNFYDLKIFLLQELENARDVDSEFQSLKEKFVVIDKLSDNLKKNELIKALDIENGASYDVFKKNIDKGYKANKSFIKELENKISSLDDDFDLSDDYDKISSEVNELKSEIKVLEGKINRKEKSLEKVNNKLNDNILRYNSLLNSYILLYNSYGLEFLSNNFKKII